MLGFRRGLARAQSREEASATLTLAATYLAARILLTSLAAASSSRLSTVGRRDAGGGFRVVRLPDGYLLHLSSSQTASIAVFLGLMAYGFVVIIFESSLVRLRVRQFEGPAL